MLIIIITMLMLIIKNNNNNKCKSWFLYSSTGRCSARSTIHLLLPTTSHWICIRTSVHNLNSLGNIPAGQPFTCARMLNPTTILCSASYRASNYTPGWSGAKRIKCLPQRRTCHARARTMNLLIVKPVPKPLDHNTCYMTFI